MAAPRSVRGRRFRIPVAAEARAPLPGAATCLQGDAKRLSGRVPGHPRAPKVGTSKGEEAMAKQQKADPGTGQNGHEEEVARYEQELAAYLQERIKPGLNSGAIPLVARSIAKEIAHREHPKGASEGAEVDDEPSAEADDEPSAEADDEPSAEADDEPSAEADDEPPAPKPTTSRKPAPKRRRRAQRRSRRRAQRRKRGAARL